MNRLNKRKKSLRRAVALCTAIATLLLPQLTVRAIEETSQDIGYVSDNQIDDILLGDLNVDGSIDSSDASEALRIYSINSTGGNVTNPAGDIDRNGSIDASDASIILGIYSELSTSSEPDKFSRLEISYDEIPMYYENNESAKTTQCVDRFETYYVCNDLDKWLYVVSSDKSKAGYVKKKSGAIGILVDNGPETFYTEERYIGEEKYPLKEIFDGKIVSDSNAELKTGDIFYRLSIAEEGWSIIYVKGKRNRYVLFGTINNFPSDVIDSNLGPCPTTTTTAPTTTKKTTATTTTVATTVSTAITTTPNSCPFEVIYVMYTAEGEPWNIREETSTASKSVGIINQGEVAELNGYVGNNWYSVKKYNDDGTTSYGYVHLCAETLLEHFRKITEEQYWQVIWYGSIEATQTTTIPPTTSTITETTTTTTTETCPFEVIYVEYTADGEPWNIMEEASMESKSIGIIMRNEVAELNGYIGNGWYSVKKYNDDGTTSYGYVYLCTETLLEHFRKITEDQYWQVIRGETIS